MIKATQNEDLYLLEGMQRGDESAIKKIYDLALLSVITWVEENSVQKQMRGMFFRMLCWHCTEG
ncbi:MAG: hypothetical protein R2879_13450 [Saprospiraceae bacterium]